MGKWGEWENLPILSLQGTKLAKLQLGQMLSVNLMGILRSERRKEARFRVSPCPVIRCILVGSGEKYAACNVCTYLRWRLIFLSLWSYKILRKHW